MVGHEIGRPLNAIGRDDDPTPDYRIASEFGHSPPCKAFEIVSSQELYSSVISRRASSPIGTPGIKSMQHEARMAEP